MGLNSPTALDAGLQGFGFLTTYNPGIVFSAFEVDAHSPGGVVMDHRENSLIPGRHNPNLGKTRYPLTELPATIGWFVGVVKYLY
jgi:hypothetical protein